MGNQSINRYKRQTILEEIGITGQQKLFNASVLVVGAGGLGCPLLLYLAAAGVGKIGIIDDDVVEESNLHRQVLYGDEDLGKQKALCAALKLRAVNPGVITEVYNTRLDSRNAGTILENYQLILDGSDNFQTRYLVNDTCVLLGKPFISGAIFRFEGQVSAFNIDGGPSYRDCFPEAPEDAPTCAEGGVTGPLAGMIGSIMAQEAIKLICGTGTSLSGKLLVMDALNWDIRQYTIKQRVPQQKIPEQFNKIQPAELQEWKEKAMDFCLIDVREAYEFEEYNIGGTNIPLYELPLSIEDIPIDKTLIFGCRNGVRSVIAAKLARERTTHQIFTIKV